MRLRNICLVVIHIIDHYILSILLLIIPKQIPWCSVILSMHHTIVEPNITPHHNLTLQAQGLGYGSSRMRTTRSSFRNRRNVMLLGINGIAMLRSLEALLIPKAALK
jgi:hypothetical protein